MLFYHGTRTDIHLSDTPYLDIARSVNAEGVIKKDPDDPEVPHVYFTDSRLKACLFALPTKARHLANGYFNGEFAHIVYDKEPDFEGVGHLYTLPESDIPGGLEQRTLGKFVSYQNVPLTAAHHSTVTAEDVFNEHAIRVFYLDPKADIIKFGPAFGRTCREKGLRGAVDHLSGLINAGLLHELPREKAAKKNDRAFGAAAFKF